VLLKTGEVLALLSGASDGGHLFQVELDGGLTRRVLPMVSPNFLAPFGQSVIVGRSFPPALVDLDGGMRTLTPPPGTSLYSLCTDGNRIFASSAPGLSVSEDGAQTWRLVDSSYMAPLSCGPGLVVGASGATLYISDGGTPLRVSIPNSLSNGSIYVDPETGRIWLSSTSGSTAYLR